jgi:hypothetical protein
MTWHGKTRHGMSRKANERHGMTWPMVRKGMVWKGEA